MDSSESFMSYNAAFYTNGFEPSATPGKLIPEDLRALGWNKLVFPNFRFDPARDVPSGYVMKAAASIGAYNIPGQESYGPVDEQRAAKVPLAVKVWLAREGEKTGNECMWVGSKGKSR